MREPERRPGSGAYPPPVLQETMVKVMQELIDLGWDVVRFAHNADWAAIAGSRPNVFGAMKGTRP